jgi:Tfp pilus assembly protein PilO
MDKYRRFYGIAAFFAGVALLIFVAVQVITPMITDLQEKSQQVESKENKARELQSKQSIVKSKIEKIQASIAGAQKKIFSPIESDLGSETLFFTLYNDLIEMIHSNSIKIKAVDYSHNPETDKFVEHGKDDYFVCEVNMELVSNYVNLGKLIQEIYQYPYYIKINKLVVKPYEKDKKVLISNLSLRLYARTEPEEDTNVAEPAMGTAN